MKEHSIVKAINFGPWRYSPTNKKMQIYTMCYQYAWHREYRQDPP